MVLPPPETSARVRGRLLCLDADLQDSFSPYRCITALFGSIPNTASDKSILETSLPAISSTVTLGVSVPPSLTP